MKWLNLFIIFFSLDSLASGVGCDELQESLAAIEYKLQSTPGSCESAPCPTKLELEQKYNQALGELVIAKGLKTIGMAIEGSHNALENMTIDDVMTAKDKFELLNNSLTKADLIHHATLLKNSGTFFKDFDKVLDLSDETNKQLSLYTIDKCKYDNNEYYNSDFCKKIISIRENDTTPNKTFYSEMVRSLHSFLKTDKMASTNSNDQQREKRFQKYRDKLLIKHDGKYITPSEYQQSDDFKNIQKLQKRSYEYMKIKSAKGNTYPIEQEILDLTKKVENISVSYNEGSVPGEMGKEFTENFYNPLSQLDLPSLLLSSPFDIAFDNGKKRADLAHKRHESLVAENLSQFLKKNQGEKGSSGRTIASICNGDKTLNCLEKLCSADPNDPNSTCQDYNSIGLNDLFQEAKILAKEKSISNDLASAKACLQSNKSQEKMICLQSIARKRKMSTDISELEDKVKKAKENLAAFHNENQFQKLEGQKLLALNALRHYNCFEPELIKHNNPLEVICKIQPLEIDKTTLTLGSNTGDIIYQMDKAEMEKIFNDSDTFANVEKYKSELEKYCADSVDEHMMHICGFYTKQSEVKEAVAEIEAHRKNVVAKQLKRQSEKYNWDKPNKQWSYGSIAKVAFQNLVSLTPLMGQAMGQVAQTKLWTSNYKLQVNAAYTAKMNQLALVRSYLSDLSSTTLTSYTDLSSFGLTTSSLSSLVI